MMKMLSKLNSARSCPDGCLGIFRRRKMDSVVHIENKLKEVTERDKVGNSRILSEGEVCGTCIIIPSVFSR